MMYDGKKVKCQKIENNIAEIVFDAQGASVNKFDRATLEELGAAVELLKTDNSLEGVLLTSAKSTFIVGADVFEFLATFKEPEETIIEWLRLTNKIFSDIEDLPCPSVTAINGFALGGGLEVALSTTYRVASTNAKVGFPEVKLGIIPGFGGTVRLPRVIGADNAIEWIASGAEQSAENAFKTGTVSAVVSPDKLKDAALHLLKQAISGEIDWKAKQQEKLDPLRLNDMESLMVFEGAKAFIAGKAGPHYPAPVKSVEVMQSAANDGRDKALEKEHKAFYQLSQGEVAASLVSVFLNDQFLKKKAKGAQKASTPIKSAAVLGAGIMGGGIAYQSASKGIPIHMKDINNEALDLGLTEASNLLNKLVTRGKIDANRMASTLNKIQATLSYDDMKNADIVIEAVVEKLEVKNKVLPEIENLLRDDAILTSNTSTISISKLAENLKRPESFCGMHFFNPVHRMPLVEVIRGEKTGEHAINQTVAYASSMGKTPLVVNDCPGFLVNRILFPYFAGFSQMVSEGVNFQKIDKVMEKFGWPMGPAYLLDVVGIDTAVHAGQVMAEGFPDRMIPTGKSGNDIMFENDRFGQKNGKGFYIHETDKKGKLQKKEDPTVHELLYTTTSEISDEEIIERMMMPMAIESSRCLEDNIVETPQEVDMGLIYGVGFPPFRAGIFKYIDSIGLNSFCENAKKYEGLGKLYEPTTQMQELAKNNKGFYSA